MNNQEIPEIIKKKPKKIAFSIKFNRFILKLKVPFKKFTDKITNWHSKKVELKAFEGIVGQILLDGTLMSLPYWFFFEFNLWSIPALGAAITLLNKQIIPMISKLLASFTLVRNK